MDLYVYYRVPATDAEAFLARARAYLGQLGAQGVAGSLSRRPEAKDGFHTWMEVFPQAADGFEATLAERVVQSGLAAFIVGERHVERFLRVA
jgi:hypothetical protein